MRPNWSLRAGRAGVRRGWVLLSVLVCLTVAMVLFGAWLKTIVLEQRHVRAQANALQAEYLAAAGVARAKARLAAEPGYSGETWRIDGQTLAARGGAVVTIRVAAAQGDGGRQIHVEAEFPDEGSWRARRTQQADFDISKGRESP